MPDRLFRFRQPESAAKGDYALGVVGADPIDPHSSQGFPLFGLVRRPGNDSRVYPVGASDQIFIDVRDVLPEVWCVERLLASGWWREYNALLRNS